MENMENLLDAQIFPDADTHTENLIGITREEC